MWLPYPHEVGKKLSVAMDTSVENCGFTDSINIFKFLSKISDVEDRLLEENILWLF